MPTLKLPEVKLFYTDDGVGDPPLLLIHGWGCDSHDWTWQIGPLAARHRTIAPDLRGHGRSTTPAHAFTPADFAHDLATLVEELELGPVIAIGHSMGAIIASVLAADYGHLVAAVVVVDPPYGLDEVAGADARRFGEQLVADTSYEVALTRLGLGGSPSALSSSGLWRRRRLLGVEHHVLAESTIAVHLGDDPLANLPATTALIGRRGVPILACHADPARAAWERQLLDLPGSKAVSFDGCGHWLHQEEVERFNATVLEWIDALPEART